MDCRLACGFTVVLGSIVLSVFPPGDEPNKLLFEIKLVGGTLAAILLGLVFVLARRSRKS